jgi:dTMP kinase
MLEEYLRARGTEPVLSCEPGGTPLGRRLRAAFLETEEEVSPIAELLLFAADRAQHVEFLIKPSLAAGRIVISDRVADATEAYQGAGRGFDKDLIAQVIGLATGGLKPDLTLFFDLSVENAMGRTGLRDAAAGERNRMDTESAEFYDRVRVAYLAIAEREPDRFRIIDANGSIESTTAQVNGLVSEFLGI